MSTIEQTNPVSDITKITNLLNDNGSMELKLSQVLQRELAGKNISQIAKQIQVSKSLIHDWTCSRRLPNAKNFPALMKLAKYLGLTLEELIFDKSSSQKTTIASTTFSDSGNSYRIEIEKFGGKS